METGRKSARMQEQVRELFEKEYGIRAIARVLGISRPTIRRILGIDRRPTAEEVPWWETVDWERIRKEHLVRGVPVTQLHREFAAEVPYVTFWRTLRDRFPAPTDITIRLEHNPGERTQIDFADGIPIVDRASGTPTSTELFCGVLGFSSYTYGEFVLDQKLPTFLSVQERMFHDFGGVTPYVVVDNLKSGVTQAHRYDPDVNATYCEFGNHYGFAVLPARPRHPRDKGKIESQIGVIQRGFYAEVRNRTFYSLAELNEAFREYLKRLNASVMKDYGVSRLERFEEEKKLLKPLPVTRYERTEWRTAKVHPDCHIQVERNFYSVPFSYVGQTVSVRLGEQVLEVFTPDGDPLAAHSRLKGVARTSTLEAHYPEAKLAVVRFDVHRAKEDAARVGEKTRELVETLFNVSHPLKHLRRVQGILRLVQSKRVSAAAMEFACTQALMFGKSRVAYIKDCAIQFEAHGNRPTLAAPIREREHIHVSGETA